MPYYLARVELHEADLLRDYQKLHAEMEKEGLAKSFLDSDKTEYKLPNGTYFCPRLENDCRTMLSKVEAAVRRVQKRASILVVADRAHEPG